MKKLTKSKICWMMLAIFLFFLACAGYTIAELSLKLQLNTSKKNVLDQVTDRSQDEIFSMDFLEGSPKIRFSLYKSVLDEEVEPGYLYELYGLEDSDKCILSKEVLLFPGGSSIRSTLEIYRMDCIYYIYHNFRVKEVIDDQGVWIYDVHVAKIEAGDIEEMHYKFKETEDHPEGLAFLYEGERAYQYTGDIQ